MTGIEVSDNEITVYGGQFVKHDGYIHRTSFLYRTLHTLSEQLKYKTLRFVFFDGEPVVFSSFDTVIAQIQKTYQIPPARLIIEIMDACPQYTNDQAQVIIRPTPFFNLVDQCLADSVQYKLHNHAVLFGGVFGRFTHHRFLMSNFLETELDKQSFVIFQPGANWVEFEIDPVKDFYTEQTSWFATRQESNATCANEHNGCVNYQISLQDYPEIWSQYLIEVVIETNTVDHSWLTEKTIRCLKTGKPFILLSTAGQLEKIRSLGFRTFDPIINESYDSIDNLESRFDAICTELKRLSQYQIQDLSQQLNSIAEYNALNFKTLKNQYYQQYVQS